MEDFIRIHLQPRQCFALSFFPPSIEHKDKTVQTKRVYQYDEDIYLSYRR